MKSINELFGSLVFNDSVMKAKLPPDIYNALKKTMTEGTHLELEVAHEVAEAMKNWALEKGATHFTHWFQPMTGITAEKHDSFIAPDPSDSGKAIMKFSGRALVKGEPDASSFPSGGLRATFEARGYTVWDTTSYAFIKNSTLCIPTAFCSYGGEALDKKTPLLRSMEALSVQALRILRLFGDKTTKRVIPQVGAEQEYFLIDAELHRKRPDLIYTGRTLFGSRPPKGEELHDHYFGSLTPRVAAFMEELDRELWKLGVFAKTKHSEVAPSQHELATIYSSANTATDYNQITMEMMKLIANRHGLACLLHEKPFAGVSGSGKHNNWSISTDSGRNLLEPGKTPEEHAQFLLFLTAVIKAVDGYHDLLRASAASPGNDHRLGADEAPPAIVSVYLGEELTAVLDSLEEKESHGDVVYREKSKTYMEIGVTALPHFRKDSSDRNRTSPFAFTGNKFEFRMLGSAFSVADSNTVINTAVAESLRTFADYLSEETHQDEQNTPSFNERLTKLLKSTYENHKRIIFNGNNYSDEWYEEAAKRKLPDTKSTVDALTAFIKPESAELFNLHRVFTENELQSRYEILSENYCKVINIEALTMLDLTKSEIIPSVIRYQNELLKLLLRKQQLDCDLNTSLERRLSTQISELSAELSLKLTALEEAVKESKSKPHEAVFYRDRVLPAMSELRTILDGLESLTAREFRTLPSYGEMLFSVV
ncbi:MAG: glutamine synthetase III [Oscillospiraceae bacterium]|nr:glutamine synthetase III [Oscillospiraceae bacterium]